MKLFYEKPELIIHNYSLPLNNVIFMTSDPTDSTGGTDHDLNDGDHYGEDIFGN